MHTTAHAMPMCLRRFCSNFELVNNYQHDDNLIVVPRNANWSSTEAAMNFHEHSHIWCNENRHHYRHSFHSKFAVKISDRKDITGVLFVRCTNTLYRSLNDSAIRRSAHALLRYALFWPLWVTHWMPSYDVLLGAVDQPEQICFADR